MEERNGSVDTKRSYAQAVKGLNKVTGAEQEGGEVQDESASPSTSGVTSEAGQEDTATSAPQGEVKKYLVVDSGPLIARTPLGKFGDEVHWARGERDVLETQITASTGCRERERRKNGE